MLFLFAALLHVALAASDLHCPIVHITGIGAYDGYYSFSGLVWNSRPVYQDRFGGVLYSANMDGQDYWIIGTTKVVTTCEGQFVRHRHRGSELDASLLVGTTWSFECGATEPYYVGFRCLNSDPISETAPVPPAGMRSKATAVVIDTSPKCSGEDVTRFFQIARQVTLERNRRNSSYAIVASGYESATIARVSRRYPPRFDEDNARNRAIRNAVPPVTGQVPSGGCVRKRNGPANNPRKTWICHATKSAKNPYVLVHVSNSAVAAHFAHQDNNDIYPESYGVDGVFYDCNCEGVNRTATESVAFFALQNPPTNPGTGFNRWALGYGSSVGGLLLRACDELRDFDVAGAAKRVLILTKSVHSGGEDWASRLDYCKNVVGAKISVRGFFPAGEVAAARAFWEQIARPKNVVITTTSASDVSESLVKSATALQTAPANSCEDEELRCDIYGDVHVVNVLGEPYDHQVVAHNVYFDAPVVVDPSVDATGQSRLYVTGVGRGIDKGRGRVVTVTRYVSIQLGGGAKLEFNVNASSVLTVDGVPHTINTAPMTQLGSVYVHYGGRSVRRSSRVENLITIQWHSDVAHLPLVQLSVRDFAPVPHVDVEVRYRPLCAAGFDPDGDHTADAWFAGLQGSGLCFQRTSGGSLTLPNHLGDEIVPRPRPDTLTELFDCTQDEMTPAERVACQTDVAVLALTPSMGPTIPPTRMPPFRPPTDAPCGGGCPSGFTCVGTSCVVDTVCVHCDATGAACHDSEADGHWEGLECKRCKRQPWSPGDAEFGGRTGYRGTHCTEKCPGCLTPPAEGARVTRPEGDVAASFVSAVVTELQEGESIRDFVDHMSNVTLQASSSCTGPVTVDITILWERSAISGPFGIFRWDDAVAAAANRSAVGTASGRAAVPDKCPGGVSATPGAPTVTQFSPAANQAATWGYGCWKDDDPEKGSCLTVPDDMAQVILKAGQQDFKFSCVESGAQICTQSVNGKAAKDISHVIYCPMVLASPEDVLPITTPPDEARTVLLHDTSTTTGCNLPGRTQIKGVTLHPGVRYGLWWLPDGWCSEGEGRFGQDPAPVTGPLAATPAATPRTGALPAVTSSPLSNFDRLQHFVFLDGDAIGSGAPPAGATIQRLVVGVEEVYGLGDEDFNDLVVLVEGPASGPDGCGLTYAVDGNVVRPPAQARSRLVPNPPTKCKVPTAPLAPVGHDLQPTVALPLSPSAWIGITYGVCDASPAIARSRTAAAEAAAVVRDAALDAATGVEDVRGLLRAGADAVVVLFFGVRCPASMTALPVARSVQRLAPPSVPVRVADEDLSHELFAAHNVSRYPVLMAFLSDGTVAVAPTSFTVDGGAILTWVQGFVTAARAATGGLGASALRSALGRDQIPLASTRPGSSVGYVLGGVVLVMVVGAVVAVAMFARAGSEAPSPSSRSRKGAGIQRAKSDDADVMMRSADSGCSDNGLMSRRRRPRADAV